MPVKEAVHMKHFAGFLHTHIQCLTTSNSPLSYWGLTNPNCSSPQDKTKKKISWAKILPLGWGEVMAWTADHGKALYIRGQIPPLSCKQNSHMELSMHRVQGQVLFYFLYRNCLEQGSLNLCFWQMWFAIKLYQGSCASLCFNNFLSLYTLEIRNVHSVCCNQHHGKISVPLYTQLSQCHYKKRYLS